MDGGTILRAEATVKTIIRVNNQKNNDKLNKT